MPKIARVGDTVEIHCPHGGIGTITSGSSNVLSNTKSVARITDTVVCNKCGQIFKIVSGSSLVFCNTIKVARIGDTVNGTCDLHLPGCPHPGQSGEIITGSPNVIVD